PCSSCSIEPGFSLSRRDRCRPSGVTLCVKGTVRVILSVETRSMADEDVKDGEGGDEPRRRRMPPPTIDLKATDVSQASASAQAAAPDPARPDPAPGGRARPPPGPATAAPAGPPRAGAAEPPRRAGPPWAHLAAGALGAVLALIIAGGVWALLGPAGDQPDDLNARLSRIETQL